MSFFRRLSIAAENSRGPWLLHEGNVWQIAFDNVSESDDGVRIELDASPVIQLLNCLPERAPRPIGAIAGNCVKGICHS
jgi:hypothetical protein